MIVPMKKVSLITMGDKKRQTLKKLRKAGIVHIDLTEGSGRRLSELGDQISLLEDALYIIPKSKNKGTKTANIDQSLAMAKEVVELSEQKKACLSEKIMLDAELERQKDWGDIDPDCLRELADKGVDIAFYEVPRTEYAALCDGVKVLRLDADRRKVRFLLVNGDSTITASLKEYRLSMPKLSSAKIEQKIAELNSNENNIEARIASYSEYYDSFKSAVKALEKEVEFETYATAMNEQELSTDTKRDISVAYFRGYVEAEKVDELKKTAADNSWGLLIEEPSEEDNVPTKLKNNRLVSLIYPLTDFLGTVPGYFEYDISGWFLAFILVFFGIIFGDGGYGLLICAAAAILIIGSLAKKKTPSSAFLLVGLFGLSTVLWGTLTCTWFGLSPEQLPRWLGALSVPVISNVYADKIWTLPWTADGVGLTTAQNLQIFCFSLALIQLTVAHIKGAVRNKKTLKMLGDIGSILQLFGIFYLVLSLVVNPVVFSFGLVIGGIPIGIVSVALIVVGFVLSFVFSNYEGSIIKSVLTSLTNIVSVLLGVVNVFSDIVSYIRLWAVGLAGAAISATVNELAGPLFGNFMFMILAIVLLVFGHGLNMILNVLSVIVHGIRLNTLEFSSHLDMSWSGHKFKPFEE